jgi:hypothetical protein
MRCFSLVIAVLLAWLDATFTASAGPIVIVEDIEGGPPDIEMMDLVRVGKVIELGASDTIVLNYLKSCQREIITGAKVTVGAEQSVVEGGKVTREKVRCDGGRIELTRELLAKGGGAIFRDPPKVASPLLALRPQFLLHGRSPVVELSPQSPVILERADRAGERYTLVPDPQRLKGAFYDFADENQSLIAGGVYRATVGPVQVLFQVDIAAQPGRTPLAGRLLMLSPQDD